MIPHCLILENPQIRNLADTLKEIGYTYERIFKLEDAKEVLENGKFHFLLMHIDDVDMEVSQKILIDLTSHFQQTLVILFTNSSRWATTATLLKQHRAYDYIQLPFDSSHVQLTLERSFQYLLANLKSQFVNEAENHLYKRMIEIFDWKKSISHKENENIAADIIHQMNINLFQGSGIGTLMSVVSIIITKAILDSDEKKYSIPKSIMDLLKENYDAAKGMFDSMSVSQSVIDDDTKVETQESPKTLLPIISNEIQILTEALEIKSQKINFSQLPISVLDKKIRLHTEKITYVIREILLNALKYSKHGDIVYLIFFHKENFLEMKVINPAYQNDDGSQGIPDKFELFVFEPFFRMSSVVDDNYAKFEQFRFGLGLPLVKKIVDQHRANVQLYNVENNMRDEKTKDVCLTIRFPLIE